LPVLLACEHAFVAGGLAHAPVEAPPALTAAVIATTAAATSSLACLAVSPERIVFRR
jgi:hypothetical protein